MAATKREMLVENLLVACAMGLLALLVAGVIFVARSESIARERSAISELSGRPVDAIPATVDDPSVRRLYRLQGSGPELYGAAIYLDTRYAAAEAVAVVGADGQIQSIRLIDLSTASSPFALPSWFSGFIGKGGDRPFPTRIEDRYLAAVAGATSCFIETSAVLGRLSATVRARAREKS